MEQQKWSLVEVDALYWVMSCHGCCLVTNGTLKNNSSPHVSCIVCCLVLGNVLYWVMYWVLSVCEDIQKGDNNRNKWLTALPCHQQGFCIAHILGIAFIYMKANMCKAFEEEMWCPIIADFDWLHSHLRTVDLTLSAVQCFLSVSCTHTSYLLHRQDC